MKILRIQILLMFLLAMALLSPGSTMAASRAWPQFEDVPLPHLKIPEIQRKKLKNGMKLFFLEDDETPVVRGYLLIRTGSIYEPPHKTGLAALTGELLRSGGSETLTPEDFNEKLAGLGAEIQSGMDRDFGFISFQCLKEDFPQVLQMVFDMMRHPAFDPQKVALAKMQLSESLRRENDEPSAIAVREFPKLVYGKENVWSRSPTLASVEAISREDLVDFYRRFFFPDRIILALAGDFKEKEAIDLLNRYSRGWKQSTQKLPKIKPLRKEWEEGIYQIQKKTDQTTLVLGHYGEKRFNPDKFSLLLLNDILGGEVMGSRLGERIRSSLGLAYGIYSQFGFETDFGLFYVFAQTKAPSTKRVLKEVRSILKEVVGGDSLSEAELEEHKKSVLNSLYSQYEPRFNFVRDEARFEYYGYPANYLEVFRKNIEKVTLKELRRAARKYLNPDALKVLVVGDMGKIGELPKAQRIFLEDHANP